MKALYYILFIALVIMTACESPTAIQDSDLAAPPGKGGPGGGGPGGGGPGGGSGGKEDKGDIYADLVYALRDVNGDFIYATFTTVDEDGLEEQHECVQPVSYISIDGIAPVENPVNGDDVWVIPLIGESMTSGDVGTLDETELEPCDPQPEYLVYVNEVEIGRLNLTRSPERVLDAALVEVMAKINSWNPLLLDHAGRLTNGDLTIDAPRENLALYRQLFTVGGLEMQLPSPPEDQLTFAYDEFHHAASGLGAGADKFGHVNVDLVWYLNRIMGLDPDFSSFTYTRSRLFRGCVSYWDLTVAPPEVRSGTIMDVVFGDVDFTGSNIHGFAHRADDSRTMILFEHDAVVTQIDPIGERGVCDALSL